MNDSRKTVRPQPRIVHFCFALDSSKGGVPAGVLLSVMQLTKFGIHNQIFSTGNTKNQIERNAIDHANLANVDFGGVDLSGSESHAFVDGIQCFNFLVHIQY